MNRIEITEALTEKYAAFVQYILGLQDDAFLFAAAEKWTAGQQLAHLVICVKPLVQVFSMEKAMIAQNFGTSGRASMTFEALRDLYETKLMEGGKAPTRFLPPSVGLAERAALCTTLTELVAALNVQVTAFVESDLDELCIPHPLMGPVTLREMLYNAIDHVQHHQAQAALNLKAMQ